MSAARPLVSALMPVRDGAATLAEALASIAAQTLDAIEIVVVDDGSRDETGRVLAEWAAHEPRLRVLRTAGIGIAGALAMGLDACQAPLVARMDADDVCEPRRLERQLALLDAEREIVLAGTHVTVVGLDGAAGAGMARHADWLAGIVTPEDVRRELWVECPILHPTFCFRREAITRIGGYRAGAFPEDYDLVLRLVAAGHALANVPEPLLVWRDSEQRASRRLPPYARSAFFRLKAARLAQTVLARRAAIVWGAGKVGRFFARELLATGVELAGFVDIDPAKHGRVVRGRPVWSPAELPMHLEREPRPLVMGAVGTLGARALIRDALRELGLAEPRDFLMVA